MPTLHPYAFCVARDASCRHFCRVRNLIAFCQNIACRHSVTFGPIFVVYSDHRLFVFEIGTQLFVGAFS